MLRLRPCPCKSFTQVFRTMSKDSGARTGCGYLYRLHWAQSPPAQVVMVDPDLFCPGNSFAQNFSAEAALVRLNVQLVMEKRQTDSGWNEVVGEKEKIAEPRSGRWISPHATAYAPPSPKLRTDSNSSMAHAWMAPHLPNPRLCNPSPNIPAHTWLR